MLDTICEFHGLLGRDHLNRGPGSNYCQWTKAPRTGLNLKPLTGNGRLYVRREKIPRGTVNINLQYMITVIIYHHRHHHHDPYAICHVVILEF